VARASGSTDAQSGKWVAGPGADFFHAVLARTRHSAFIVEDLGLITPDVYALRDQFRLPGTRVLQFAFDGHSDNPYLPHNYVTNAVVYTGTMTTLRLAAVVDEFAGLPTKNPVELPELPGGESGEAAPALMDLAWSSLAAVSMAPLQDLLNLGGEARMNIPGRAKAIGALALHGRHAVRSGFEWLRQSDGDSKRKCSCNSASAEDAESSITNLKAKTLPIDASEDCLRTQDNSD